MIRRTVCWLLAMVLWGWAAPGAQAQPLAVAAPVLTISAAPWPLVVNQGARITVTASNPSGENADNVVITAAAPDNMSIANVSATQGGINVYNSALTNYVGTLAPGQTVYLYIDVIIVATYPSDAPFNLCAGLTFAGGTARLSCLPNQPASTKPGKPPVELPPSGQRPISDPNRPPVYLPVTGGIQPMDWGGLAAIVIVAGLLGLAWRRRKSIDHNDS